jgi:hypothetical protein
VRLFIDWIIRLPEALDSELRQELIAYEEKNQMPYVMSFERMAEKRGEERGEANALLTLFHAKFGPPGPEVEARIHAAQSRQLQQWLKRILTVDQPEDLFR